MKTSNSLNQIYYSLRPFIPRRFQLLTRRMMAMRKRSLVKDIWPIDKECSEPPVWWRGWPDGNQFALVLTHDVDTKEGQNKCRQLMQLEEELGFRSSFNFVPERYKVSSELRHHLVARGFEVGVHGLYHDGKLYKSRKIFQERATKINHYLKEWNCVGFRSPAMHHNLDWIGELDIKYDCSTFDTDPFEPQSDGVRTIFPICIENYLTSKKYIELPYTLSQDFTIFILLQYKDINIWKEKIDWVANKGGMALLNTHPDYMNFEVSKNNISEYKYEYYEDFLNYARSKYSGSYWHALPNQVSEYCNSLVNSHKLT